MHMLNHLSIVYYSVEMRQIYNGIQSTFRMISIKLQTIIGRASSSLTILRCLQLDFNSPMRTTLHTLRYILDF